MICLSVCSPIWGAWRETGSGGSDPFQPMQSASPLFPTLVQMRAALVKVVEVLRDGGDKHIRYLDGLQVGGIS